METMSQASGGEVSVYSTSDTVSDVVQFYRENAPAGGWERTMALASAEEGGIIVWEKGDYSAQMFTGVKDKDTLILLGCGPKLGSAAAPSMLTYSEEDGLADKSVLAVSIAGDGSVWLGTRVGGLSYFDGSSWTTYAEEDGLPSGAMYVQAVVLDADGNPWIGTDAGVARYDGASWQALEGPAKKKVSAMAMGADGALWVAVCDTSIGGVYRFDGQDWTAYLYDETDGLEDCCVNDVAVGPNGNVWAATDNGLASFDGAAWTNHTADDGLVGNEVDAVAIDQDGAVWAGTDEGASRFDGGSWKAYTEDDGLLDADISAIEAAPDGSVWFATGSGVSCLRDGRWESYTEEEGLPSNRVSSIAPAPDGRIWLGTAFDGVAVLDPSE
jgi:ligand-binding sensor domain-containing protein